MTLRNAFEDLGTEGMLRKILRAVTFAKDNADRLSVAVGNQPVVSVNTANTSVALSTGLGVVPYSTGAWNAHDIRAEYQEFSHQSFQAVRSRWTIS